VARFGLRQRRGTLLYARIWGRSGQAASYFVLIDMNFKVRLFHLCFIWQKYSGFFLFHLLWRKALFIMRLQQLLPKYHAPYIDAKYF
jgi:hypothetical protein